ncbi:MAG: hypothetical protein ACRDTF_18175, partial [Pseudonocardiaceae bacterium]
DAFLYLANWGTHRLMIRQPARLLDLETAARYCPGDSADCWAAGDHVILDLVSEQEGGDWEEGGEEQLASIIPTRAELASGDLRLLYFAWLLCVQTEELEEEVTEPPVPPGLQTLTASLCSFADFLRLDEDLLAVAATASERPAPVDTSRHDMARWIELLPVAEKNALLLRVAHGDDAHLRMELRRRFHEQRCAPSTSNAAAGSRTVGELLEAARLHRAEREALAATRREQERARHERVAAITREKHLDELAADEEHAWHRVSVSLETKKPTEYDKAVQLLVDLRAVADRRNHRDVFDRRFTQLRQQHLTKPSLLQRFDRANLTPVAAEPER